MNRLTTWACLTVWFAGALVASAADDKKAVAKIDPKADVVVRAMTKAAADAKAFSVDVASNMTVQPINQTNTNATKLVVDRTGPGRISATLVSGDTGATIVNDGKNLTIAVPMLKRYSVEKAPGSISDEFPPSLGGLLMMQGLQFVAPLWTEKPYESLIDGVDEIKYVGEEDLNGAKTDHITVVQEPCDLEMWISKGDKPTIQKISPDMAKLLAGTRGQLPPGITLQLAIVFEHWNLDPKLTDDSFKFTAAEGMEKVDSLFGGSTRGPHPLENKPAPDFEVKLLGGGELKLSQHKGKNIVVLDFWATWCGPCVQALPTIIEVTDSFKGKGVVFYAVNLREDVETVRTFLEEKKLAPAVAMDSEGDVSSKYGVEAIPQTMIIDKEGVVRVVHVGSSPELKKTLAAELEALLAGKDPKGDKADKGNNADKEEK